MPRRGCWDGRPWQVEFQPQLPGGGPSPGGPAGWNRRWRTSRRRSAGRAPRCFQTFGGVLTAQAHQAQTGAIAHFRGLVPESGGTTAPCGARRVGPTQQTRRRPLQILLVRLGAVFGNGRGLIGQKASRMARPPDPSWKTSKVAAVRRMSTAHQSVGERYRNVPRRANDSRVPSACATGRSHSARLEEGVARVYRTRRTGCRACPGVCGMAYG